MLSSSLLFAFTVFSAVQANTVVTKTITVNAAAPTTTKIVKHNYGFPTKLFFDESLAQGTPLVTNTTGKVSDLFIKSIVSNGSLPTTCPGPFNKSNTAGWTKMTYGIPWMLEPKNAPGMTNETYKIIGYQTSRPLNKSETLFHAGHGQDFMRFSNGGGELCGNNYPWQPRVAHLAKSNCNDTHIFSKYDNTRCAVVTMKAEAAKSQKYRRGIHLPKAEMAEQLNHWLENHGRPSLAPGHATRDLVGNDDEDTVDYSQVKRDIQVSEETHSDGISLLRLMETVAAEVAAEITNTTLVNAKFDANLSQGAPPHYKSYKTSSDLWVKADIGSKPATECPKPFNASNTAGWLRMIYGVPWQHNAKDNSTAVLMWQMSRELNQDEILYHAGWGTVFMASEAGHQCGTNYPYKIAKPKARPLSKCTDVRVPLNPARCINLVSTN